MAMSIQAKRKSKRDLNKTSITVRRSKTPLERTTHVRSGKVQVFFRGLEDALVGEITKASAVFGCVAWVTNQRILKALSQKHTSLIVQKEDFLRPDFDDDGESMEDYYAKIRFLYGRLKCDITPWGMWEVKSKICDELGYCGTMSWDGRDYEPVKCLGGLKAPSALSRPLLHHKFVVLCDVKESKYTDEYGTDVVLVPAPRSVWTGSFNFTPNATRSLENAVLIEDPVIARAYLDEYLYLYQFTEPLNWDQDWVDERELIVGPKS